MTSRWRARRKPHHHLALTAPGLVASQSQARAFHGCEGSRRSERVNLNGVRSVRHRVREVHGNERSSTRPGGLQAVLPEDIDWEPFPAFPPPARLAVVVGDPSQPAPYVVRVKLPSGVKLMPYRHHQDRVYTVMSGVFYIGVGERFDDGKLQAYPPGAVIVLPGGTPHFHWAKSSEYVTQVTAFGPISLEYMDPEDDPRNK